MTSTDTIARARSGARWLAGSPAAVALVALAAACSSSNSTATDGGSSSSSGGGHVAGKTCTYISNSQPPAGACSTKGGPIDGANNNHCVVNGAQQVQATGQCIGLDAAVPSSGDDSSSGGDDSGGDDGAASAPDADTGECSEPGYGVTNYGTSAADDDCKYDVSYTATPICQMQNAYFTVTATKRTDKSPLTGASVSAEVYNDDCATIALNSGQTTVEQGNGTYKVGPIQFGKGGKWIVRFHFNECCSDAPADSPHGHAAFWVNVP